MWNWLEKPDQPFKVGFMLRVLFKAAVLFLLLNAIFALLTPLETLGQLSLYNVVFPGRERLPYGENPAQSYSLSLDNVPAMFASHELTTSKPDDEFRVLLLGDSSTWGWLLETIDTLAAQLNALEPTTDGKMLRFYNIGYPIMSLTKDLLLLDYAMRYDPDLIVWLVTAESFPRDKQLFPPIVANNPDRVRDLIADFDLNLDPDDPRFEETDFLDETIYGRRRQLADLLRLQLYAPMWASTGIDQHIPDEYTLRSSDFEQDVSWGEFTEPQPFTDDDLAFDVLAAGISRVGDVPVLIVNEPMFISDGENSDLRYNFFYPRWAYDQYREMLTERAESNGWQFVDLWDALPPDEFTDTPVHITPDGTETLASLLLPEILRLADAAD